MDKTIEACLKSIVNNNPAEIIIIDGKSRDKTLSIARKYTDKIFSDEGRGPSYAHQLGAEQASQQYIAFVDADIVLPAGTLSRMLIELEFYGYADIQALWHAASRSTYWDRAQDWHVRTFQSRKNGGLSAALLKKDIVLDIGFDSSLRARFAGFAGDDYDFMLKLAKHGYTSGNSSVVVYHHHRADFRSVMKRQFQLGRSSPYLMRRHGLYHPGLWSPLAMVYWIIACIVRGKPWFAPYFIMAWGVQTAGLLKGFTELRYEATILGL